MEDLLLKLAATVDRQKEEIRLLKEDLKKSSYRSIFGERKLGRVIKNEKYTW